MSETIPTTGQACWILHQPGEAGGIAADEAGRNLLFRDREDAIAALLHSGLHREGFVCQGVSDAAALLAAFEGDGQEGVWFEEERAATTPLSAGGQGDE